MDKRISDYKYSRITPQILVGPLPPTGGAISDLASDVFLCAKEYQPDQSCFHGIQVHHCPLIDEEEPFTPEEFEQVKQNVTKAMEVIRSGGVCLFTCRAGLNRSVLLATLTAYNLGLGVSDFISKVRLLRGPSAMSNKYFQQVISASTV